MWGVFPGRLPRYLFLLFLSSCGDMALQGPVAMGPKFTLVKASPALIDLNNEPGCEAVVTIRHDGGRVTAPLRLNTVGNSAGILAIRENTCQDRRLGRGFWANCRVRVGLSGTSNPAPVQAIFYVEDDYARHTVFRVQYRDDIPCAGG